MSALTVYAGVSDFRNPFHHLPPTGGEEKSLKPSCTTIPFRVLSSSKFQGQAITLQSAEEVTGMFLQFVYTPFYTCTVVPPKTCSNTLFRKFSTRKNSCMLKLFHARVQASVCGFGSQIWE